MSSIDAIAAIPERGIIRWTNGLSVLVGIDGVLFDGVELYHGESLASGLGPDRDELPPDRPVRWQTEEPADKVVPVSIKEKGIWNVGEIGHLGGRISIDHVLDFLNELADLFDDFEYLIEVGAAEYFENVSDEAHVVVSFILVIVVVVHSTDILEDLSVMVRGWHRSS